jgi:hypothetical protein
VQIPINTAVAGQIKFEDDWFYALFIYVICIFSLLAARILYNSLYKTVHQKI